MFRKACIPCVALLFVALPSLGFAKAEQRTERVVFKDGSATVKGHIKGDQSVDYVFPSGAGESLTVKLKTNSTYNYFNLMAPGETETAFFIGSTSGNVYEGVLPTSGDYKARVYLMHGAPREGAGYSLTITLGQKSATVEKGPDYADGLTGGPDYWEVTGVGTGDTLNLREKPTPHAQKISEFTNGTVLRNLGCKNTRGQRWCRVEELQHSSLRGWVNGHYLRESAGPR